MVATAFGAPIALDAPQPIQPTVPVQSFLSTVPEWFPTADKAKVLAAGVTYSPVGYGAAAVYDARCGAQGNKSTPPTNPGLVVNLPFIVEQAFKCGYAGAGWPYYTTRARMLEESSLSTAIEKEFWTGTLIAANPHLAEASLSGAQIINSGTAVKPDKALAYLNSALAEAYGGSRGFIHCTPRTATLMGANGLFATEGPKLVTQVNRNWVVAGGGYPGTKYDGNAPAANTEWAYATGPLAYVLGDPVFTPETIYQAIDRDKNDVTIRSEREVLILFDDVVHFAVLVDLT